MDLARGVGIAHLGIDGLERAVKAQQLAAAVVGTKAKQAAAGRLHLHPGGVGRFEKGLRIRLVRLALVISSLARIALELQRLETAGNRQGIEHGGTRGTQQQVTQGGCIHGHLGAQVQLEVVRKFVEAALEVLPPGLRRHNAARMAIGLVGDPGNSGGDIVHTCGPDAVFL